MNQLENSCRTSAPNNQPVAEARRKSKLEMHDFGLQHNFPIVNSEVVYNLFGMFPVSSRFK